MVISLGLHWKQLSFQSFKLSCLIPSSSLCLRLVLCACAFKGSRRRCSPLNSSVRSRLWKCHLLKRQMLSGLWGTSCVRPAGERIAAALGDSCRGRGVAVIGVKNPCFPISGDGFGDLNNQWGVLILPLPASSPKSFLSVPCPISLVPFRAYCVLGSRHTAMNKTNSLFSCRFLSRISRKCSLLGFPSISRHTPDIKSELPGVQDPKAHAIKWDHSQISGEGPFLSMALWSLVHEWIQPLRRFLPPSWGPRGAGYRMSWIILNDSLLV